MEREDTKSRLYFGTGTDSFEGGKARVKQYQKGKKIPFGVKEALLDGFTISHMGVVARATRPFIAKIAETRLVFLAIECSLMFQSWRLKSWGVKSAEDYGMEQLRGWSLEWYEYDGLCSHSVYTEGITSRLVDIIPEELQRILTDRKVRNKQAVDKWRKKDPDKVNAMEHRRYYKLKAEQLRSSGRMGRNALRHTLRRIETPSTRSLESYMPRTKPRDTSSVDHAIKSSASRRTWAHTTVRMGTSRSWRH